MDKALSDICLGLSEVCIMLSKQKQDEEEILNNKLKDMVEELTKEHPKEAKVIRNLLKRKRDNHKKQVKSFKQKAEVFRKLSELKSLEVKNGKNKI